MSTGVSIQVTADELGKRALVTTGGPGVEEVCVIHGLLHFTRYSPAGRQRDKN